jgi:hypothetical protein
VFLCVWRVSGACLERVWRVAPARRACGTYMVRRERGVCLSGTCLVRVLLVSGASLVDRLFVFEACSCGFTMCLARVWRVSGARLARVCCVRLARVWRVSGASLVQVWCVSVFFVCLARVCSVSGAWRLRGGRVERTWCVASVTYLRRERVWCVSSSCLAHLWFSGCLFRSVCVLAYPALARVWRVVWRVSTACVLCVWCVSGACLARVWCVAGACRCFVCLERVWRVSGACLARGACAEDARGVHRASRACFCESRACLVRVLLASGASLV